MKQLKADVVVIAAGPAGLAAAVTAAENGASVIVFEKASISGGTANMGSGPFAVESKVQKLNQMTLSKEDAFRLYMDFNQWRVNGRLVSELINMSASTIDWLEKMGVEFLAVSSHNPGYNYTFHPVKPESGKGSGGATLMKILTERAKELGVEIFLKTPAQKIIKENGRIAGVIAENKPEELIQVATKAAIIATGGTGGYYANRLPSLTNDGVRMAREAGAEITEVTIGPQPAVSDINQNLRGGSTVFVTFRQPNLIVNLLGERFMDEEVLIISPFSSNACGRQKDHTVFNIFDEDTKNYYVENGVEFPAPAGGARLSGVKTTNFDTELQQAFEKGLKHLFMADSLETLARETGIEFDSLQQTVDEYNHACETGRDEIFHKKARYLRPVINPKFYAIKSIFDPPKVIEGIKINYKTEVLTKDYEVIAGLYTAGVDIGSELYTYTYPFLLPGNAMGYAINSGRIAGERAAKYALAK